MTASSKVRAEPALSGASPAGGGVKSGCRGTRPVIGVPPRPEDGPERRDTVKLRDRGTRAEGREDENRLGIQPECRTNEGWSK